MKVTIILLEFNGAWACCGREDTGLMLFFDEGYADRNSAIFASGVRLAWFLSRVSAPDFPDVELVDGGAINSNSFLDFLTVLDRALLEKRNASVVKTTTLGTQ